MLDEGLTGPLLKFQLKSLHMVENLYDVVCFDKIHVYYFQYLLTAYCVPSTLLAACSLNELIIYYRDLAMCVT